MRPGLAVVVQYESGSRHVAHDFTWTFFHNVD
jgi:hypothetical protein